MSTAVFCRIQGELARFEADTADHEAARKAVADAFAAQNKRPDGAIVAVINGGKQP